MENEKCTKNMFYGALVAILVSFVIIIFIFAGADFTSLKNHWLYKLLKDHGSLIGGILAIIGVFVMVNNQNKTTRESLDQQSKTTKQMIENQNETTNRMIKNSIDAIKHESLEIKKEKAIEFILTAESVLYKYFSGNKTSAVLSNSDASESLNHIRRHLLYAKYVFGNENNVASKCFGVINSYINFIEHICIEEMSEYRISMAYSALYIELNSLSMYGSDMYLSMIRECDDEISVYGLMNNNFYMAVYHIYELGEAPCPEIENWKEASTLNMRDEMRKNQVFRYCKKIILDAAIPILLYELEKINIKVEN